LANKKEEASRAQYTTYPTSVKEMFLAGWPQDIYIQVGTYYSYRN